MRDDKWFYRRTFFVKGHKYIKHVKNKKYWRGEPLNFTWSKRGKQARKAFVITCRAMLRWKMAEED